jgi:hypothetical protein
MPYALNLKFLNTTPILGYQHAPLPFTTSISAAMAERHTTSSDFLNMCLEEMEAEMHQQRSAPRRKRKLEDEDEGEGEIVSRSNYPNIGGFVSLDHQSTYAIMADQVLRREYSNSMSSQERFFPQHSSLKSKQTSKDKAMVESSSKLPKYPEFWTIPLQQLEIEMAELEMKYMRTINPTTKYQEMVRAYTVRKGKEQAAAFDWNDVGLSPFLAQQYKRAQVANMACKSSEPSEWGS